MNDDFSCSLFLSVVHSFFPPDSVFSFKDSQWPSQSTETLPCHFCRDKFAVNLYSWHILCRPRCLIFAFIQSQILYVPSKSFSWDSPVYQQKYLYMCGYIPLHFLPSFLSITHSSSPPMLLMIRCLKTVLEVAHCWLKWLIIGLNDAFCIQATICD